MNSGDPNKVEVDFDIGGDAAETLEEIAGKAEKVADQEERYQKLLAKTIKMEEQRNRLKSDLLRLGVRQSQADKRAQAEAERSARRASYMSDDAVTKRRMEAADQSRRVQERLEAAGYGRPSIEEEVQRRIGKRNRESSVRGRMAELGFGPKPSSPLTEMQEAGQRLLAGEKEDRIQRLMNRMKGRPEGLAGLVHGAENILGMEDSRQLSALYGKAKGMVGPAAGTALIATAGKFAMDGAATVSGQMKHGSPYQDEFSRTRDVYHNLPFGREFMDIKDLVLGRSQQINRVNKANIENETRSPIEYESFLTRANLEQDRRAAQLDAVSVRRNSLPGFPGGERRGVGQQQQYQLAQRLLPLQEQLAEAATARAEAENQVTAAQEKQKKLADERQKIRDRIDRTVEGSKRMNLQSGDPEYLRRANAISVDEARLVDFDRQEIAGRMDLKQRELQATQARRNEAMANIAVGQGNLADLQQREQTAASQRQRLVMMGPEGRLRGQFALMAAKSYGVGMLPQDMMSSGMAYAPETFRNLAEQEGGQYVNEARPFAPEEFRDDLPTARSQVDAAGRRLQGQKQAARESSADDVERAMETGGDKLVKSLVEVIGKLFERMANDVAELKKDQGTAESYRQPRG